MDRQFDKEEILVPDYNMTIHSLFIHVLDKRVDSYTNQALGAKLMCIMFGLNGEHQSEIRTMLHYRHFSLSKKISSGRCDYLSDLMKGAQDLNPDFHTNLP